MKNAAKVVFLSNYFNHHQKPFSDAMFTRLGDGYLFVETSSMSSWRKALGYSMNEYPEYLVSKGLFREEKIHYQLLIMQADVVIIGSAPNELVKGRIKAGKLVFRYSERPLKKGFALWKYPYRFLKWHLMNPPGKNIYMLCASAYTSGDYAKFGLFRNRCYRWGYFPETKHYDDVDGLVANKQRNSLVWVARYIDWKHPEIAVEIARRLKADGYAFSLDMIGNGAMLDEITRMVKDEGLDDMIHMRGAMSPEEVRGYMEKAQVHIFTSDRQEGWGAVLNEAMNSACVPIANIDIGSAPFLIEDGVNGFTYRNTDELYEKVKYLLENKNICEEIAHKAYQTIVDEWNAENAANKLLTLSGKILNGEKNPDAFVAGVCKRIKKTKR